MGASSSQKQEADKSISNEIENVKLEIGDINLIKSKYILNDIFSFLDIKKN